MTARQWTREELDRVHPLPDGWEWVHSDDGTWTAVLTDDLGAWVDHVTVRAGEDGVSRLVFGGVELREDVVLPVILASKGMDSFAAMAEALDGRRETAIARSVAAPHERGECLHLGLSEAYGEAVALLRRGTVKP